MSLKLVVRSVVAALFVVVMLGGVPARAGEVGMLVCHSPQAQGYIVASAKTYSCTFSPTEGGVQYYQATIYRFGAQAGVESNAGLAWAVFSLTSHVGPGALAGSYAGASAGAAVVLGARANALVGGLPNAFALQPVSFEGMTGLNGVATVTGLSLQAVVPRARHHRRHR
jgi:hypothetical protein